MKKQLITIIAALLLLLVFVSCNQDTDGIYRKTISSSAKSSYVCQSYLGEFGKNHYVLSNEGIIFFELNSDFHAPVIDTLSTGAHKAVRGAYLSESGVISAIDVDGQLFEIDLNNNGKITDKTGQIFRVLSKSGYALQAVEEGAATLKVVDLNGSTPDVCRVSKIITDNEHVYFIGFDGAFAQDGTPLTYDGKAVFNGLNIFLITKAGGKSYVACSGENGYEIHKLDGNNISKESLGTLTAKPTAAFAINDHTIAYKTEATIDIFDASSENENKVNPNKRDGWATDIYTSSTKTSEFVQIGDYIYAINISGGIIRIDTANEKNYTVFTE